MQILLVEDNEELASALKTLLEAQQYLVTLANTGTDGMYLIEEEHFDLIILDRMLPEKDGLCILKETRMLNINTPILMMTAMGQVSDKVEGLEAGADDYIVKPFDKRELFARINALLRRPEVIVSQDKLFYGDVTLDLNEMMLKGQKGETSIALREQMILKLFFQNPEQSIRREVLFSKVWGYDTEVETANIDSYIYYVRRRLKSVSDTVEIKTLPKVGYRLGKTDD